MTVYILIALLTHDGFSRSYSGTLNIEFDSLKKCEDAKLVVENRFNTRILECVEIKK